MKYLWSLIKDNKWYLCWVLTGLLCITFGGLYWSTIIGKLVVVFGIIATMVSVIIGLKNSGLFWIEHD